MDIYFIMNYKTLIIFISILVTDISTYNCVLADERNSEQRQIILEFHKALISSMKASSIETNLKRFNELKPIITRSFHIPTMTKIIAGSAWNNSSENQQKKLIEAFVRVTTATYISQFNSFSGQVFKIVAETDGPQNTSLINTQIISPGRKPVSIIYVMRHIKSKLGIIDVLLGMRISELAKKRSEYRRSLFTNGLEGLIKTLNRKSLRSILCVF